MTVGGPGRRPAGRRGVADVVRRVDVDAVAPRLDIAALLDRLDLTDVVLARVDLQRVVREVLTRLDEETLAEVLVLVDVDAVAARLDVEPVIDRVDLTALVLERVDLGAVVDAALAKVDLIGLAEQVIDGVDLPELIRESTGSMASDTVRGVRMRGIEADQTVSRAMDRLLPSPAPARPGPREHGGRRGGRTLEGGGVSPLPREARPYQGQRAGVVTRLAAAVIDSLVVGPSCVAGYFGFAGVLFLIDPRSFSLPHSGLILSIFMAGFVAEVYLTVSWWIGGRTYGYLVMGLRLPAAAAGIRAS